MCVEACGLDVSIECLLELQFRRVESGLERSLAGGEFGIEGILKFVRAGGDFGIESASVLM
jgi:hypothetical protein